MFAPRNLTEKNNLPKIPENLYLTHRKSVKMA
jgi:hypothetical protein